MLSFVAPGTLPSIPASHAPHPHQHSSVAWVGCAFCVTGTRSTGSSSTRRQSRSRPRSCSPLVLGSDGGSRACGGDVGLIAATASRWGADGDELDGGNDGKDRRRRAERRKPLRAPWEDIQWSNPSNPSSRRAARGGERVAWKDVDDEEEEEEMLGLEDGSRSMVQPRGYTRSYDDADVDTRPRRRRSRDDIDAEPVPTGWDTAQWFTGAQEANQGGLYEWARSFYNTLFWYGGASSEGEDELPAMNFQDLLERFDLPAGEQSSARPRPIVPPEDLAAEQDFRWRPSGREATGGATATAESTNWSRAKGRGSTASGGATGSSRRRARRERDERDLDWESVGRAEREMHAAGGRGRREGGDDGDVVAIGQLRRKQRQLAEREHKCEVDLEKVRDRLDVVDATVELWMRRSAGMLSRGGSETDTDVLQAKRRIYGLKEEGRQLDSATVELEGRLEDCRAKLDRIVQELEFLGEAAMPRAFYTPGEGDDEIVAKAETVEAGIQAGGGGVKGDVNPSMTTPSGDDTKVVEIGGLGLNAESKRPTEAVPAVTEADT
ncbi:unnamed protein product [Ectocarpus sp. CCAP 1310/34]|nr:unnamed protein product [Ectocarpus sp. CCAP 1310/34]